MSMLFQSGALFTDLTVFENVAFRCASTASCRRR
ncbi:Probable phospholipid import ATP-binding protein MlaF [Serratia rubidaea]|uniref:Probable phospholipid import ATP-binding protein MlaF n=1 Tax=Serratia rubidaea TaxID=61652 RepID=A0A447QJQ9_SERRU|nr:Probable phospholipid import ATP-binding protein MlaF [Serratia rubidaea]